MIVFLKIKCIDLNILIFLDGWGWGHDLTFSKILVISLLVIISNKEKTQRLMKKNIIWSQLTINKTHTDWIEMYLIIAFARL